MRIVLIIIFILLQQAAFADDFYHFNADQDAKRFAALTAEIRCVVCQNQSLAESNAPLANDLRNKIYHMIDEKKSDDEIKNYLTARYGEFILLQPLFNKTTFLLWTFPLFAIGFAVFIIFRRKPRS